MWQERLAQLVTTCHWIGAKGWAPATGGNRECIAARTNVETLKRNQPVHEVGEDGKPGRADVLVSAIISLVNRAEEKLTDEHQHELHRHLLMSMVN